MFLCPRGLTGGWETYHHQHLTLRCTGRTLGKLINAISSLFPPSSSSLSLPPHLCCSDFMFLLRLLQWYEALDSLYLTPGRGRKVEVDFHVFRLNVRKQSLVFALILLKSEGCFQTLTVLREKEGARCSLKILCREEKIHQLIYQSKISKSLSLLLHDF